jgi:hypothetical protein
LSQDVSRNRLRLNLGQSETNLGPRHGGEIEHEQIVVGIARCDEIPAKGFLPASIATIA